MGSSTSFLFIDGELIYIQLRGEKRCIYCIARSVFRVRAFAVCRLSPATLLFLYCALLAHVRCKGFVVILFYITLRYITSPTEDKSGGAEERTREERERHTQREWGAETERQRWGERDTHRKRDRDRQTDRQRHRERGAEIESERVLVYVVKDLWYRVLL